MKPIILLLPALIILLFSCKSEKHKDVFVPTYENPDIYGSGKRTQIKEERKEKHGLKGKHGCVPNDKLVLDNNNYFFDFPVQIEGETFYYIPYKTVYVHKRDSTILSYSPGFYRSIKSEISTWNGFIDSCELMSKQYGVGICALPNDTLINDSFDRWYFEDKALIFNRIVCPIEKKDCLKN